MAPPQEDNLRSLLTRSDFARLDVPMAKLRGWIGDGWLEQIGTAPTADGSTGEPVFAIISRQLRAELLPRLQQIGRAEAALTPIRARSQLLRLMLARKGIMLPLDDDGDAVTVKSRLIEELAAGLLGSDLASALQEAATALEREVEAVRQQLGLQREPFGAGVAAAPRSAAPARTGGSAAGAQHGEAWFETAEMLAATSVWGGGDVPAQPPLPASPALDAAVAAVSERLRYVGLTLSGAPAALAETAATAPEPAAVAEPAGDGSTAADLVEVAATAGDSDMPPAATAPAADGDGAAGAELPAVAVQSSPAEAETAATVPVAEAPAAADQVEGAAADGEIRSAPAPAADGDGAAGDDLPAAAAEAAPAEVESATMEPAAEAVPTAEATTAAAPVDVAAAAADGENPPAAAAPAAEPKAAAAGSANAQRITEDELASLAGAANLLDFGVTFREGLNEEEVAERLVPQVTMAVTETLVAMLGDDDSPLAAAAAGKDGAARLDLQPLTRELEQLRLGMQQLAERRATATGPDALLRELGQLHGAVQQLADRPPAVADLGPVSQELAKLNGLVELLADRRGDPPGLQKIASALDLGFARLAAAGEVGASIRTVGKDLGDAIRDHRGGEPAPPVPQPRRSPWLVPVAAIGLLLLCWAAVLYLKSGDARLALGSLLAVGLIGSAVVAFRRD